jgi:hypothetical protein
MKFPIVCKPLEVQAVTESEIASLALKFYLDSHCEEGHDRENWLCAEYMLVQKHLIQCQISSLHDRESGVIPGAEIGFSNLSWSAPVSGRSIAQPTRPLETIESL